MAKLSFNSGNKVYEIEEESTGELICVITVDTTDLGLLGRLKEMENKMQEAIPDFKDVSTDDQAIEYLAAADKNVRDIIDSTFNADICSKLFGKKNCISMDSVTGTSLAERFMTMIAPAIIKDITSALQASEDRMSKYLKE